MSSYRNHIKKMTAILLTSTGKNANANETESVEIKKVIKHKKVKNQLPELTEIEKEEIAKVDDFHEFIHGSTVRDDSEE